MDEILAKLRKSTKPTEKDIEIIDDFSFNSSTIPDSETSFEPTSSQCQTPFQFIKLNFEKIKSIRDSNCITVEEVLKSSDYKILSTLICIVHKIIRFSKDTVYLEVIDETGTIGCSCTGELLKEENIKIGSLLKLKEFSLWKINGNHINLVKNNINQI